MKRVMISVVGGAIGSLLGMAVVSLGAGNAVWIACAVAGVILPHLVLGAPGR